MDRSERVRGGCWHPQQEVMRLRKSWFGRHGSLGEKGIADLVRVCSFCRIVFKCVKKLKPRNIEIVHIEIHSWKEDLSCHLCGHESDRKITNKWETLYFFFSHLLRFLNKINKTMLWYAIIVIYLNSRNKKNIAKCCFCDVNYCVAPYKILGDRRKWWNATKFIL